MPEGQNEVEVIPYVERGELLVLWQLHRPGLGNSVVITSGALSQPREHLSACWIVAWATPQ